MLGNVIINRPGVAEAVLQSAPPLIAELQICQSSLVYLLIGKSGRLYICVVVRSAGRSVVCHGRDSSDVTLAFEDAQVIQTLMDDE